MNKLLRIFCGATFVVGLLAIVARADDPPPVEVPDHDVNNNPINPVSPTPYVTQWTWMAGPKETHYVTREFILDNGYGVCFYQVTVLYVMDGETMTYYTYEQRAPSPWGAENQN